jgi:prevent-host-death family protein
LTTADNGQKIVVMKGRRRAAKVQPRSGRFSQSVPAAAFKAKCLELMERVRESGMEYVVTKHGRPVAKLVPYTASRRQPVFGSMKGTVLEYERPFDPIDGEWNVNRD